MKLVRDARTLKTKAIESLRAAMTAFNSYDDSGRVTTVLMNSQHACEMLLKAVLVQGKGKVFDKSTGRAISFDRCLGLCSAHHQLTPEEILFPAARFGPGQWSFSKRPSDQSKSSCWNRHVQASWHGWSVAAARLMTSRSPVG